ncbi:MAG: phytanoyl-CoA dioxygenase family protein [Candidatus Latescibacteria bacterium]|nr:phytanoyl-CoA dioxygenase family protein [Candidatus Latescibacterota bacterium]
MNDDDLKALKKEFHDAGYIVLHGWIEPELVERIHAEACRHEGISIFERESVGDLLCHPRVVRLISFLLETLDVAISPFRFWNHLSKGGFSDGGGWHVDDTWMADRKLTEILCMFYPQDVTEEMGPTMVLPGSHRRLYTPPQTSKLGWIRGQQKLIVEAGALAICYPSLLHARAAHLSEKPRSMIKYGYEVANPKYGYYLTGAASRNFRRTELGRALTVYAEARDERDAVWNSYWQFHRSYTFQDFKHQIGVVGRELRAHLEREKSSDERCNDER